MGMDLERSEESGLNEVAMEWMATEVGGPMANGIASDCYSYDQWEWRMQWSDLNESDDGR
jgi:hypothetical protein